MSGCGTIQFLARDNYDLVPQDLEEAATRSLRQQPYLTVLCNSTVVPILKIG